MAIDFGSQIIFGLKILILVGCVSALATAGGKKFGKVGAIVGGVIGFFLGLWINSQIYA